MQNWYKKAQIDTTSISYGNTLPIIQHAFVFNEPDKPVLNPGQIVLTTGAAKFIKDNMINIQTYITRHINGDWGNLEEEDKAVNRQSLENKGMVMSFYTFDKGKLWIITDIGWQTTTILLPEEY